MGMVRVMHLYFIFWRSPSHIFGISDARHFKFLVLIDTEEYYCNLQV